MWLILAKNPFRLQAMLFVEIRQKCYYMFNFMASNEINKDFIMLVTMEGGSQQGYGS